jgi:hypothetical protein
MGRQLYLVLDMFLVIARVTFERGRCKNILLISSGLARTEVIHVPFSVYLGQPISYLCMLQNQRLLVINLVFPMLKI